MLKNAKTSRIIIAASILLVLTAITVTATQSTRFAFIDSVKEFFGMASVTTPTRTAAPMREVTRTANLLAPAPQPMFFAGSVSLTSTAPYTQNFDSLVNSGTSSTTPTGWELAETGTNANTTYTASVGSSSTGDTFSYGSLSATDRALGGLQSGSLAPRFGSVYVNNTGATITSLALSYTGEQWRIGNTGAARDDRLDFQYNLGATAVSSTSGTWVDVNDLDFVNLIKTNATTSALDGNIAGNRSTMSFTVTGLSISNGSTFVLRWVDFDATSSDDGLSIDDFSLTPTLDPLSGTYTVGSGGDFTTLTAAVAAYVSRGVSGPVVFSLTDATYAGETYPITIGAASGASSTNTLTIKPNTGISSAFTTSGSNLLVLNGASNVIIDGSNTVGGTTRNLSFAVSAGVTSSAILLSGNTNNNTIKNVVLSGGGDNSQNAVLMFGTTSVGQTINNNTVNNCLIQAYSAGFRPKYTVSMSDTRSGTANTGNVLSNNTINDFSWNGIFLSGGDYQNTTISGNQIFGTTSINGANFADVNGIQVGSALGTVTITGNRIYTLPVSGSGMTSVAGISSFMTTGDVYTIANNLVSVDSTSVPAYGISSSGTAGTANIYFNSIRIGGAATSSSSFGISAGSTSTRNIKNNSIYNARTRVSGSLKNYGLYAGTTNLTSDNNNIFSSGTSGYSFTASNTTTDYSTLADWQTATSKDAASVSGDPLYTSSTDLHILTSGSPSPVSTAGTPIAGFTTDFDGETRSASTPDIGADEFVDPPLISKSFATSPINVSGTSNMTLRVDNTNSVDLTGVSYTDTMPTGLSLADVASTSFCGGTISISANVVTVSNITVPAIGSCVTVRTVTANGAATGVLTNTTSTVTSTNGGTGNSASANITVNIPQYVLTVTSNGTGAGSVLSDLGVIVCPGICSDTYNAGTVVTLTASPNGGSVFAGWSGTAGCSGTGSCVTTMDAAKTATATFNIAPPTLGNYSDTSVVQSSNSTITPSAAPTNTTSVSVRATASPGHFLGELEADPVTGVVRVTNPHPAGIFTVTVRATGPSGTDTETFTLTVTSGTECTQGTGFVSLPDVGVGGNSYGVAVGDFNGDANQDVAVSYTNGGSGAVAIRLGDGLGGFTSAADVPMGSLVGDISVGDFNNDGKQDLAVVNKAGVNDQVSIRLGDGLGGFSGTTEVIVSSGPNRLAVGDLNNDGNLDLAVTNRGVDTLSVLNGDGLGGFATSPPIVTPSQPSDVLIVDIDADGNTDIVVGLLGTNQILYLKGNGVGAFIAETIAIANHTTTSLAAVKYVGASSRVQVVTTSPTTIHSGGSGATNVIDADIEPPIVSAVIRSAGTADGPNSVAVADFDRDGQPDLVTVNKDSDGYSLDFGPGDIRGYLQQGTLGDGPFDVAVGDFDGDGAQDFVSSNSGSTFLSVRRSVCEPAGTIQFSSPTYSQAEGDSGQPVVTITGTRTGGSRGEVGASYHTEDGILAVVGVDYTQATGFMSWADGDTADKTFSFTTIGDTDYELNETVNMEFEDPDGGATLGSPSTAVFTIVDDDNPPSTLVVDNNGDLDDGFCGYNHCSLREAINAANLLPDTNTINFNIPGTGIQTISPATALPNITSPVVINGYSQPSSSANTLAVGNDAVINIRLDCAGGSMDQALELQAANSEVRGLMITRCATAIGVEAADAVIAGNFLGTDGTADLGNGNGVSSIANNTRVGSTSPADRNVISGNTSYGVVGVAVSGMTIQGNYVGTNAAGTAAIANDLCGIDLRITGGTNTIGGTTVGAGNVISGNTYCGLLAGSGNIIRGNLIGLRADSTVAVPNGIGIVNDVGATNVTVGGIGAGEANVIAGNAGAGVRFSSLTTAGANIRRNSIFNNGALGIDLQHPSELPNGVNTNDFSDPDTGPNGLQNYPEITFAQQGVTANIVATLNTAPNSALGYAVDFFSSPTCDPTGYGEGQTYLGSVPTNPTDANGDTGTFNFVPTSLTPGHFVTATATDSLGNTSEFSQCFQVTALEPEMTVSGFGITVGDGDSDPDLTDHTDFGSASIAGGTVVRTFTIENTGNADLELTGSPLVQILGNNPGDFSVTVLPTTPVNGPGGFTTFQVTFAPTDLGPRTAEISIANNDTDENPYNFAIEGMGTAPPSPTVTSLNPTSGTTAGGNSVAITGTNLTGASAVTFGGDPGISVVAVTDTLVTVTAPAHAAGVVDVIVTTPGGASANTAADDYTYITPDAAPEVNFTNPANGATGVSITQPVGVGFSENVSLAANAITLECPSGNMILQYPPSPMASVAGVTFYPTMPATTTCTVTVDASKVNDVDANDPPDFMAANYGFSFTTATPPTVTTNAASPISYTTATMNGTANPSGFATNFYFRWTATPQTVCSDSWGVILAGVPASDSGTSPVAFSKPVHEPIVPGETYYYCAIAENAGGRVFGNVVTFQAQPSDPTTTTVISSLNPSYAGQSVTFTARVRRTADNTIPFQGGFVFVGDGNCISTTDSLQGYNPIDVNGETTFITSALAIGNKTVTACYGGGGPGIANSQGAVTQTVDPIPVNLSVNTNTADEDTPTIVTVTATAMSPVVGNQTVTVGAAGTNITAGDYNFGSTTITITSGQSSGSTSFIVVDDGVYEGSETATLTISNPTSGIVIGTAQQNVSIADNDTAPTLAIVDVTDTEGDGPGTKAFVFTIVRTGMTELAAGANFDTTPGSASEGVCTSVGTDFLGVGGNFGIAPGGATGTTTVTVQVCPDTEFEGDENFTVDLTSPMNATFSDDSGLGTITNDDSAATLGNYDDTSVAFAGNTTVTPSAPPANATNVVVSASTGYAGAFAGGLTINQTTGVVTVTDAHPAGTYTVTVNAFGPGSVATDTFVLTVSPGATCGQSSFDPAVNYTVGTNPNKVVTADINLDGKPDMVVANGVSNNVSVRLGNGSGGFGAVANFAVGDHPNSIAVADFNLDGNPDIATANDLSTNLSILLGNGSGGFGPATSVSTGNNPFGVVTADFNFDGKADLAAANSTDGNVSVFLGDGAGGFGAATNFGVGTNPIEVAVGDFNNDGKADLVTANNGSNNVSVLIGNGLGGFAAAANFSVGTLPQSLAVGDLNHDGKLDIVVTTTAALGASVLIGDGTGSFAAATSTDVGTNPTGVAISDVNLDGHPDLVVTNFTAPAPNVSVTLGDGTGVFATPAAFGAGDNTRSVAAGDFNLDGKPDLAVANSGSANVSVLLNVCVAPVVDLTILKSDGGATVAAGGTVAYTLNYANNGTTPVTGVVLTETVPAHSSFNAGASTAGWVCTPNGNAGNNCTLAVGSLAFGGSGSAVFAVDVETPILGGATQIDNAASIADEGTHGADVNLTNNTSSDSTPLNIPISFAINDVTANEGDVGSTLFTFTITKTGLNGQPTTITLQTCDVTATAPGDYASLGSCIVPVRPFGAESTLVGGDTVTFAPTDTSKEVTVLVVGDTVVETDETFTLKMVTSTNGTFTDDEGLGTIVNDDSVCTPPPPNMSAWYDGSGTGSTLTDIGGSNNGTLSGAAFAPGKVGQGVSFNGTTDYVEMGDSAALNSTTGTWDFWVKTTQAGPGYKGIIGKLDSNSAGGIIVALAPDGRVLVQQKFSNPLSSDITSTNPVNDGQFHHIAVTFQSGGPLTLYVDGVVSGTPVVSAVTFAFAPVPMRLGVMLHTFWEPFGGTIDEVEVFNRILDATEIAAIANAGSAGKCHTSTVRFAQATDSITEDGAVTFTAIRDGANDSPVTVNYLFNNGGTDTATGGAACGGAVDYIDGNDQFSFGVGVSSIPFVVDTCPDAAIEGNETFSLTLANPSSGLSIVAPATETVTIVDDDFAPTQDTDVTLSGSALTIEDVNGANTDDDIRLSCNAGNLRINDPTHLLNAGTGTQIDTHTVEVSLAGLTSIQVNSLAGNDALTVDLSGCDIVPSSGITFNGGDPTSGTGDRLNIVGGNQGQVTYHYNNASDGNVQMQNFGTVNYTGLEPISNTGTASDVIFELPAGANAATLGDDGTGGNGMSRLSGATFEDTDFANPTSSVTIKRGDAADTLAVNALPDLNSSLSIGTSVDTFSSISINGAFTMASGNSLAGFAAGTISFPNNTSDVATSGLGTIALTTARNISFGSGSSATTVDGALTLNANQATSTAGTFIGIDIDRASIRSTGTGVVTVNGKGGTGAGSQHGVRVTGSGSLIKGGNAAGLTTNVSGTGGAGTSATNIGVLVTVGGATISSFGGNVSVTGTGGAMGDSHGVRVFTDSAITAEGTGDVTVMGTGGGSAASGGCFGVDVRATNAFITSSGGNVSVTGQGGTCVQNNGVVLAGPTSGTPSTITSGGSGTVTVTGTGNASAGSSIDDGVTLAVLARITSGGVGAVQVTGTAGNSAGSVGVQLFTGAAAPAINSGGGTITVTGTSTTSSGILTAAGSQIAPSPSATVTLIADSMSLSGTINSGTSSTTLRQKTNGVAINLGTAGDPSAGPLNLTDAELDLITAGTLFVGNSASGQISTTAPISHPNNLTLTTGAGMTLTNSVTMAVDKTLTGVALGTTTGAITSTGALTATGTGGVSITTARNIALNAGISTANGPLTLNANQQVTATTGAFTGIALTAVTVEATGTGVVTVNGRGGTGPGIALSGGAIIRGGSTSGSTTTSVSGTGGSGGSNLHGLQAGGTITSLGGDVSVTGIGGAGGDARGVILFGGGQILSGGSGAVTVSGTGGTSGGNNFGVVADDIGSRITASGTGNVIVNGTGGSGTSNGVYLTRSGAINSSGGTIIVNGTAGGGGFGIALDSLGAGAPVISSSSNATVTLNADTMFLDGGSSTISAGTGQVNLRQATSGRAIDLGAADVAGATLGLTDAELDRVTAGTLNIGNSLTGSVSVSAAITQTKLTNITSSITTTVLTGGSLGIFGTVTGATDAIIVNSGGTVAPGASPGVINSMGNLNLGAGSTYAVEIGGTTPGNGGGFHDQIDVTGTVALGGANLTLSTPGFVPTVGQSYRIINNDSTDAVTGTFAGLGNGAPINNFLGVTGLRANIFYNAGLDSNDVVITATCQVDPVVTTNANNGAGSLRQAVLDACPDSTITFAGSVGPTISLSGGQIIIDKNLIIDGPATPLTVQNTQLAGPTSRVFLVNTGITAMIQDLTISGGSTNGANGGGILSAGALTVTNATISTNAAGTGWGGGIYVSGGSLNLNGSTLNNNTASNGGGLGTEAGTIGISTSTIRNNTATGAGGGIVSLEATVGVGANITLTDTTIGGTAGQGNQASSGGGVANYVGTFQMTGGSISRNTATGGGTPVGGGIYAPAGSVTLTGINAEANTATGGTPSGGFLHRNGGSTVTISLSRIVGNTIGSGSNGPAINNGAAGAVSAINNWWGCDGFPGTAGCDSNTGTVTSNPRIDLRLSAAPTTITVGGTSTLTADVVKNTNGVDLNGGNAPTVLVGRTLTFAGDSHGSVSAPLVEPIPVSGIVTPKVFTPHNNSTGCGSAAPSVQLDNGNQPVSITVQCADLTMTKTNNVSGSVLAGFPWTWTLTINNIGDTSAVIPAGQMIVADNLPDGPEMTYGTPTTTLANATCAIDGSKNLTCTANAGGVTIAPNSPFTVTFSATASSAGAQVNPRLAGIATVDPSGSLVTESDEGNNNATDTVNVIANPTFSINSVSVVETNGGTTNATFTITKTGDISQPSVVRISTQDASATDADNDYEPRSNVDVPFTATQMTETVTVTVNGDTTLEPDETFNVLLTAVSNATIGTGTGVGTILNDECSPMPANMLSWYSGEGNADDIVGSNPGTWTGTPKYAIGKVAQAFDFDGTNRISASGSGSLNITGAQMTMDGWVYPRSGANAYYFGRTASSDHPYVLMTISGNLVVIISTATDNQQFDTGFVMPLNTWTHIAMTYAAAAAGDKLRVYANGTQVFSAPTTGGNLRSSSLPLTLGGRTAGDNPFNGLIDEVEVFGTALSPSAIAAIASASGGGKCHTSTIQLSSAAYSVTEGNVTVPITVTRVGAHDTPATFSFATSAGTATPGAGNDYDDLTATGVTFNPGEVSKVYNIQIHDDAIFEGPETVNLTLSGISGAGVTAGSPGTGVLTINPDGKSAPAFSINNAAPVFETNGAGTTTATFTITKLNPTELSSTVHFETNDGSATVADDDYETNSGDVVFLPTENSKDVTVTIKGDDTFEPDETFTVLLTPVDNATIAVGGGTGVGTILNDECTPPPAGMASWFDGSGTAPNAIDIVGPNNGTLQGGAAFGTGKVGQGFVLNGTSAYVSVPDNTANSPTNAITVDAWIKPDAVNGLRTIVSKYDSSTNQIAWEFGVRDGRLELIVQQAGLLTSPYRYSRSDLAVVPVGTYSHVAATFDINGQAIHLFVNGSEVTSTLDPGSSVLTSINDSNAPMFIGAIRDISQVSSFFSGDIDEVEIFGQALTQPQIEAIALASGGGKCRTPIVQFERSAEMEDESQTANVIVRRIVSVAGTTDVTAATVPGGTATGGAACTAGVDYKTTSQLLSFGNGDVEQTMQIEICPDLEYETPQTIKLQLSGPSGAAVLGGNSEIFLTINDTATQFTNNHDPIDIPAFGATASPYPSSINVTGAPTVNGGMRVTLYDVELANPDNLDVLLVGPLGQKMVIMGDAGGSTAMSGPVTLTFDDSAGQVLPNGGPLTTGKFEPTTWEPVIAAFPATAPAFPYVIPGSALGGPPSLGSGFGAGNPNGQWRLFVRDDAGAAFTEAGQPGAIAGGWGLQFVVPTAAGVSVSGRVTTAEGRGIRGAIVTITGNSLATPINVTTGVNGRYIVEGLTAGETYIVTIRSRRFVFSNPSRIVTLNDNVIDADFIADPSTTRGDQ